MELSEPVSATDEVAILPTTDSTTNEVGSGVPYPNLVQWLNYSVSLFPLEAQDSILQSIVDFLQHRPHTTETLPAIIASDPLFPTIQKDPVAKETRRGPKSERSESEGAGPSSTRGRQPIRIDPNSPLARAAAPPAHALRQEDDSYEEPLKRFARNDEFQGNLPPGWRVEVVMRSKGKFRGKKADKYWYHPNGMRFKSFAAVQEYLSAHPEEMTTIEEKTPIVYRVSSRSRRDVPEHQSKSRKRSAAEAGISGDEQQSNAPMDDTSDASTAHKKRRIDQPEPFTFQFPLLPPTLPKAIVSITDVRSRDGTNGLLEFKTTYSDGSVSWEIATSFYDEQTGTFHPVYIEFLTRNAVDDAAKASAPQQ